MRVLVVDDEPVARRRLLHILKDLPDIEHIAEAGSAREALAALATARPDWMLLDIAMPGVDGLTLASMPSLPPVVFVTAHSHHALAAFELGAHDYLVKPVTADRLKACVERLRARLGDIAPPAAERWRLTVIDGTLRRFVDARRITLFVAGDKYVSFHLDGEELLLRESLDALEGRLREYGFLRAHRSALVRRDAVEAFDSANGGTLILKCGSKIAVSRRTLASIRASLGV
ncbi:MAG: LytTR family DNA-binding domain-containing protein [Polyangiaceae bacterium]